MTSGKRAREQRRKQNAAADERQALAERVAAADFSRKLHRAETHIDAVEQSIQWWLSGGAYALIEEFNPETREYLLKAKITEPLPDDLPLMIGDAVHSLRSALDHIAYSLALDGYQTQNPGAAIPAGHQRRIMFPVVATSNDPRTTVEDFYATVVRQQLRYVPGPAAACIECLQPHKRLPGNPTADPLWIINELDVIDKHRKLHSVAAGNPIRELAIGGPGDTVVTEHLLFDWGPVDGERVFVRLVFGPGTTDGMQMKREVARFVTLSDGPVGDASGEVVALLRALHADVKDTVVPALIPFLFP